MLSDVVCIIQADQEWLGDEADEAHAVVWEGGSTSEERGREGSERERGAISVSVS